VRINPLRKSILWLAGGFTIGCVSLTGLLSLGFYSIRQQLVPLKPPELTIIPVESKSTPTHTAIPGSQSTIQVQTPTFNPGVGPALALNILVEVHGTGGEGLRIRENAGLNYKINYLGLDQEVFQIIDGPISADGFTWWKLVNPYNPNVAGWAASIYLRPLEGE
jgi:hypothetical protein